MIKEQEQQNKSSLLEQEQLSAQLHFSEESVALQVRNHHISNCCNGFSKVKQGQS